MKRLLPTFLSAILCATTLWCAADTPSSANGFAATFPSRIALASSLRDSGEFALSALEYRRIAADLEPGDPAIPSLHLAAADAYRLQKRWDRMGKMLDAADDAVSASEVLQGGASSSPATRSFADALLFLRLRRAEGLQDWTSAAYYAEDLAANCAPATCAPAVQTADIASWASRAAAANHLRAGDEAAARAAAANDQATCAAIDRYASGHDKSPRIGGFLGIVPGLGYAYSGEWGNMFRSIFLNGIFGWAMFECADHERWGLFAITTFFEFTWYTGSIYGGIDAAHRYNKNRLNEAANAIIDGPAPQLRQDPAIDFFSLRLAF